MNTLSPVEAHVATADAVNIADTRPIPQSILLADVVRWGQEAEQQDDLGGAKPTIASAMLDISIATQNLSSSRMLRSLFPELSELDGQESPDQDSEKTVAAQYALSRLVGAMSLAGGASDALSPYESTPQDKLIFDLENVTHGACAIIVDRCRLLASPFQGEPSLEDDGQWYSDGNGLYVLASPDAGVSQETLDQLTLATGSPENARRLIDAPNSVALRPYVSLSYLDRGPQ